MPSPIEMMIDKACGIQGDTPKPPAPAERPSPRLMQKQGEALCKLADAAIEWRIKQPFPNGPSSVEKDLADAVEYLLGLGWK